MKSDFWPKAWAVERWLNRGGIDEHRRAAEELTSDLVLQAFLFTERGAARPEWLETFRSVGLFDEPPKVQRTAEGLQAPSWPILKFLKKVAQKEPVQIAEILQQIQTDNWWVVADALEVATELPATVAQKPITHLLKQYQGISIQWVAPSVLGRVVGLLAQTSASTHAVEEAVFRVLDRFLADRQRPYAVSEVLDELHENLGPNLRAALASGIQEAMLARDRYEGLRFLYFENLSSAEAVNLTDDAIASLLNAWLTLVEAEAKELGSGQCVIRALPLLATTSPLIRQMGLRLLRIGLDADQKDPAASTLLSRLVDVGLVTDRDVYSEAIPLLSTHWNVLPTNTQAREAARLMELAGSEDFPSYLVRDWLHALAGKLGPQAEVSLAALVERYGPAREDFVDKGHFSFWTGPESPVAPETAASLSVEDLLPYMRHPPGKAQTEHWGPSPEGLARVLQAEVARRPDEFEPFLDEVVASVRYPSLIYAVIQGLRSAYEKEPPGVDQASAILEFLTSAVARERAGAFDGPEELPASASTISGAVGDFLESAAAWAIERFDSTITVQLLRDVYEDPEPVEEPQGVAEQSSSDQEPAAVGLNTARGKALRAVLAIAARCWASSDPPEPFTVQVESLLRDIALTERHPGVRSGFGFYLPQMLLRAPDLWNDLKDALLPIGDDFKREWCAVFGTYVAFHRAYVDLALNLQAHYDLALQRRDDPDCWYLKKIFSRLINHVLALAVRSENGYQNWSRQTLGALAAATSEQAGTSFASLGRAAQKNDSGVDKRLLVDVIRARLARIRGAPEMRPEETRAMAQALFFTREPIEDVGGLLLDIWALGGITEGDDLSAYLEDCDRGRSRTGAELLQRAGDAGAFRWSKDRDILRRQIREYSERHPEPMWDLVNKLGSQSHFYVEPEAVTLSEAMRSPTSNKSRGPAHDAVVIDPGVKESSEQIESSDGEEQMGGAET